jgi:hypothetical protein
LTYSNTADASLSRHDSNVIDVDGSENINSAKSKHQCAASTHLTTTPSRVLFKDNASSSSSIKSIKYNSSLRPAITSEIISSFLMFFMRAFISIFKFFTFPIMI